MKHYNISYQSFLDFIKTWDNKFSQILGTFLPETTYWNDRTTLDSISNEAIDRTIRVVSIYQEYDDMLRNATKIKNGYEISTQSGNIVKVTFINRGKEFFVKVSISLESSLNYSLKKYAKFVSTSIFIDGKWYYAYPSFNCNNDNHFAQYLNENKIVQITPEVAQDALKSFLSYKYCENFTIQVTNNFVVVEFDEHSHTGKTIWKNKFILKMRKGQWSALWSNDKQ